MQNVTHRVDKKKLIIEVDLTQRLGDSQSGKTIIIATTGGNADVGVDGIKFGLNVFVKKNGADEKGGKGK